jgi:hypothetical protein
LVICDPDIIIISVKDIAIGSSGDNSLDASRWFRRAIEDSVAQIFGAERELSRLTHVIRHDGSQGLPLPPADGRRIYRLSVSLGSRGRVAIPSGDFGRGFAHVLDDYSLHAVLRGLDTITDFVSYLRAKEDYPSEIISAGEEQLLALYLDNNRQIPPKDRLVIPPGLWEELVARPEYRAKINNNDVSYIWDALIERIAGHHLQGQLELSGNLADPERALRMMARETRFDRRLLSRVTVDFSERAKRREIESRMVRSPSGILYVLLRKPPETLRTDRQAELQLRCYVARGVRQECTTIVGIATEVERAPQGFSIDLCYLEKPAWTAADQERLREIQADLGIFASAKQSSHHEKEYPSP